MAEIGPAAGDDGAEPYTFDDDLVAAARGGIAGFRKLYGPFNEIAPLRAHISIEDVGKTAVYLGSDLSTAVTGEVVYVDGGFNILGVPSVGE